MIAGRLKAWQGRVEQERKEHKLRYLFWETTRACNLRCGHCGSSCTVLGPGELATDEIKAVFESIAADFDARSIMVAVTGGEPLLRKDLFDVMGHVRGLGFQWGMVTNGMLVDNDVVEKCHGAGMNTVTVSVDGLRKAHELIRKGGSFDRTIDALLLLKGSGYFSVVQATTCVSQYNIGDLQGLYELFSRMGIDEWRLLTVTPIGRAKDDPNFRLQPSQLRSLLDFIVRKRREKGLRITFEEEGFLGTEYEGKVRDSLYFCPAGISIASILANGDIGACPNLPPKFIQGNVRHDRFSDVWEHRYQSMRDLSWKRCGLCDGCEWWEFCLGNSLHLWDLREGRPSMCHIRILAESRRKQGNFGR
ncbi:MAG TPA: radical SAM protein [Methanocella sp.]|uniref:radical SAM/SPASM domain-containing protein n=1 Tax=Methanocella sp. TaxID=2052833 RepID=UPI002BA6B4A1|nr:radical SAM protein [Methanocella sp.]HTY89740.1 radical SAM protein [Methanocella sp.]